MSIKNLIAIINIFILVLYGICFADTTEFYNITNIPFSIGKVFETNILNKEKPDIIIINDVHCQPYVQKNIYSIIEYITSKMSIDKIFVEGATEGKVNLSAVMDIEKSIRENILNKMLNEGLINGTEYFCYATNTDLYGIEDAALYSQTLQKAYLLIQNEKFLLSKLNKIKKDFNKIKKKYYSKDIIDFEYLFFNRTNLETSEYCKLLTDIANKYSVDIKEYNDIYNFINISKYTDELKPYKKNYYRDFNVLTQKLKNNVSADIYMNFIKKYKNNNIEENLVIAYKLTNKFLSNKEQEYYKYIDTIELKLNLIKMFNIGKYLKEEEGFYEKLFNKIVQTEAQKQIAFLEQMLFFTEKYIGLNINFYDFDKFNDNRDKFLEILNNTDFIKNKTELIAVLQNEELKEYYNNNIKRDNVFFENIQKQIKKDSINILTVGGFHKKFLNLLNDNNKKYVVIFPNTKDGNNKLYKQLIIDIGSHQ